MVKNNIRKLRDQAHLTQSELVERIRAGGASITTGIMSQIESGQSIPNDEQLRCMAAALGVSASAIYSPKVMEALFGADDATEKPVRTASGTKKICLKVYELPSTAKIVDDIVCDKGYNSRSEFLSYVLHSHLERAGLI